MIIYANRLRTMRGTIDLLLQIVWNNGESGSKDQLSARPRRGGRSGRSFPHGLLSGSTRALRSDFLLSLFFAEKIDFFSVRVLESAQFHDMFT